MLRGLTAFTDDDAGFPGTAGYDSGVRRRNTKSAHASIDTCWVDSPWPNQNPEPGTGKLTRGGVATNKKINCGSL